MGKKAFTVISFGNYETKILISNYVNGKVLPVYKKAFITKNFFNDSEITDINQLIDTLKKKLNKIPVNVYKTKIIFNIPVKSLNIREAQSIEYKIGQNLTDREWNRIWKSHCNNYKKNKSDFEFDAQPFFVSVNNKNVWPIPFGTMVDTISFISKHYHYNLHYIKMYEYIAQNLNFENVTYLCDSLAISKLFRNFEKQHILLINVGHSESSIEFYSNLVLSKQMPIKFGMKGLISKICQVANIDEINAINILKIFTDLFKFDQALPLVNHFQEKFLEYSQTRIGDIAAIIQEWVNELTRIINDNVEKIYSVNLWVDEIYINSPTNFIKPCTKIMKRQLSHPTEIYCLEPNFIDIDVHKYISLIASILYCLK